MLHPYPLVHDVLCSRLFNCTSPHLASTLVWQLRKAICIGNFHCLIYDHALYLEGVWLCLTTRLDGTCRRICFVHFAKFQLYGYCTQVEQKRLVNIFLLSLSHLEDDILLKHILKTAKGNFSFAIWLFIIYRNLLIEAHKVAHGARRGACAEGGQSVSGQGGEMLLLLEWH